MVKGTIKRFDAKQGFGFFKTLETDDVFFHIKDMKKGLLTFEFDVEKTEKGLKAINIKKTKQVITIL